jgi:tRNA 2-thiocytidine biosynthesis protein TtcA
VVIRPLAYVKEKDLARYAEVRAFPIIPCDLCGAQDQLQRKQVKQLLRQWEKEFPGRVETVFNSLQRVTPSHLLDRKLFDFPAVSGAGVAVDDGDKAFDAEDFSSIETVVLRMTPTPE